MTANFRSCGCGAAQSTFICGHAETLSRRNLLGAAAGFGALAFTASGEADARILAPARRQWIDVHHHIAPPFYMERMRERLMAQGGGRMLPQVAAWTPARSIEAMDAEGIAAAIVSISTPGVWTGDAAGTAALARECNDYARDLVAQHPNRLGFFATVPLPDVEASLAEVARAYDDLGADGIGLMTSYDTLWPGAPEFAPLLDELNRRDAVVYVHPTAAACCRNLQPGVVQPMLEFVFDTTRAIVSLITSGALVRYPSIKFIFSHSGGTIPMLAHRIEEVARQTRPDLPQFAPNGVEALLGLLHYDVANSLNEASFSALRATVPLSQVLLGTDYPYQSMDLTLSGFNTLRLSSSIQRQIGRENAARLFPRLAATTRTR